MLWTIRIRHLSVFGRIARLTQGTPAHNAVHCQAGLASGRSLGRDWRCRPGRPRARWTDQLCNDTGSVPANLWRQTGHPMGPWWSDATARAGYTMTTMTFICFTVCYTGIPVTDALKLAEVRSFWRQIATAGCYGWSLRAMMMMMMYVTLLSAPGQHCRAALYKCIL